MTSLDIVSMPKNKEAQHCGYRTGAFIFYAKADVQKILYLTQCVAYASQDNAARNPSSQRPAVEFSG